ARELNHGVCMWPLAEIGLQHVGLTRRLGQRFELAPRHHAHIADCFQPRMVPDRADVAVSIRRRSFAGRIDQPALINVIEVLRNALAQFLKNGLGAEVGAFVRRWILWESPTEPVHRTSRAQRGSRSPSYSKWRVAQG